MAKQKIHHLVNIQKVFADSIYVMACGRFWRLSRPKGFCCSHVTMVDCQTCLPETHWGRQMLRDRCKHERRWYSHYKNKFGTKVEMCMCLDCSRRLSPKKYPKNK